MRFVWWLLYWFDRSPSVIALCPTGSAIGSAPSTPSIPARLGQMSYSTYLVHYPTLAVIHALLPVHSPVILFVIGAIPIALLSWALYSLVELPGIQLGRRLTNGWNQSRAHDL